MDGGILSNFNNAFGDELPFLRADYEAIKQIALRNGGHISAKEIFSVTMGGYMKLSLIKDQLIADGIITKLDPDKTDEQEENN